MRLVIAFLFCLLSSIAHGQNFNPAITWSNWYFAVAGSSPGTQVWSTATGAFVAVSNGTYQTWVAGTNTAIAGVISGVADNGSGKCRFTIGNTSQLTTGQVLATTGILGVTACNATAAITVVSGTTFDMTSVAFSGTYTSGGQVQGPGYIDTIANLRAAINAQAVSAYSTISPQTTTNSGASPVTLTNPLPSLKISITVACTAGSVILPKMNLTNSLPLNYTLRIVNGCPNLADGFTVFAQDGTTLVAAGVSHTLAGQGNYVDLTLTDQSTQNGTFSLVYNNTISMTPSRWVWTGSDGTLAAGSGGNGGLPYYSNGGTPSVLAGNATATRKFALEQSSVYQLDTIQLADFPTQATNTVLGNATSGTAVPTALSVGTCSTAASALNWTTNTGFGCNTSITAAAVPVGGITGLGTGVATALAVNIGTAGSFVTNGGALGSPSSAGTLPAHTLGGTVSGGGNQINNVVIGAVTPLAGTFNAFNVTNNQAAPTLATITNNSANGAASALFTATNGTVQTQIGMGGTAYSAYGALGPNVAFWYVQNNPMVLMADGSGTIAFAAGGNATRAMVQAGFSVGTATDPGAGAILANTSIAATTFASIGTKIRAAGTAPALTSCGTGSPAISGSDLAGEVTMGTSATGCIITFNVTYAAVPYCVVHWPAQALASQSYVVAADKITLTQTSTSGNKAYYHCIARSGG